MKRKLAKLTSNVMNPFLVSLALIFLLSFESTASTAEALKWALILIAISILPVFAVIIYLAHNDQIEGIFINIRRQRTKIYFLAGICTIAGCALLIYLGAPLILLAAFIAALAAIVIFMCINFFWKISLHAAFAAASVTVLTILYGSFGAITAMLVPTVGWARMELKHHSLAQVVVGTLLATSIVVVVFHLFGLIRNTPL